MSDRTHYPPGTCVGCQRPTDVMPLCTDCRAVYEHDGDSWDFKDTHSQHTRDLAAAWKRGYHRGYGDLESAVDLHIGASYKPGHSSDFPF